MSLERIGRKKADTGTYRDIFSAKEIRSLLYYQNAGKNIVLSDNEKHLEKFYSIENAYEVINMLMFDDIGSEQVRLSAEGRWMDPDILNNMNELLDVYCNLYSAICKYTYLIKKRAVYTYRDDRRYTYLHMKTHKFNESFLSATLNEKKQMNLFQEKEDLTFFEFKVDQSIEYLDINEVLGEMSKYPVYHVDRIVRETGKMFNDQSHIIYVNSQIKDETALGKLMHDFTCTNAKDMYYEVLADRVHYFKEDEKGVAIMCKAMEDMRNEAAREAEKMKAIRMARLMIEDGKLNYEDIAMYTELTLEEVEKIALEKKSA